jgi:uncharacterized membrane protein
MARDYFSPQDHESIISTIKAAEANTSGEIQVHIETNCPDEPEVRARVIFHELKMDQTKLRNGVLFYLALEDNKFAIIGDEGISKKLPPHFFDDIKSQMQQNFDYENYTAGLCEGIFMAGQALKEHYPFSSDDVNELPDQISFGD